MENFVIQGGESLEGEISVSGAKNAALKLISAALLTEEKCIIHGVPDIADVRHLLDILVKLGVKIEFKDHTLALEAKSLVSGNPDYQLVKHMRASVVIIGSLLGRVGEVQIPHPGGCLIGARPIDTHIRAFEQMGVKVVHSEDMYTFSAHPLQGGKVILDEMSVSATENILIAACCATGVTEIHLAASEPEIVDLAKFLISMGAKIEGVGTSIIRVTGQKKLQGTKYTILPDRIEAGTFAIAAAVSRGDVKIRGVIADHLDAVLNTFRKANVTFSIEKENDVLSTLHIQPTTMFEPIHIDTRPYPGFPTDLQAPISVLMTQARGTSRIFETMYDARLGYIRELARMGADATILDTHTAVIEGPTTLYGKRITSLDIRAGATLLIAAMIAHGESVLERVDLIDRGYEEIETRLNGIGAKIKRIQST
ncbi:UDP-N-acetylglucosamine 1-carboxyvinyltransferase [Patescibacteria group bacterium]